MGNQHRHLSQYGKGIEWAGGFHIPLPLPLAAVWLSEGAPGMYARYVLPLVSFGWTGAGISGRRFDLASMLFFLGFLLGDPGRCLPFFVFWFGLGACWKWSGGMGWGGVVVRIGDPSIDDIGRSDFDILFSSSLLTKASRNCFLQVTLLFCFQQ